jgi:hypothetical protein
MARVRKSDVSSRLLVSWNKYLADRSIGDGILRFRDTLRLR